LATGQTDPLAVEQSVSVIIHSGPAYSMPAGPIRMIKVLLVRYG